MEFETEQWNCPALWWRINPKPNLVQRL